MFIHEMTESECRDALKKAIVGRLACARDNQPYVVPMYFAYHERHLYCISTSGQKIAWMRSNPLVCVEVDELTSHNEWMSVIVFGRYEELPDVPEYKYARRQALELLQRRSAWWWEPACISENHRDSPHSCTPIAYRIHIDRISGQQARPVNTASVDAAAENKIAKRSLISSLFGHRRHRHPMEGACND
jgi:nitroimidazol reductase NimA-like FMN-containing flavoprotein (pyridoxamine 5'-phosphate oxidase superfamily)